MHEGCSQGRVLPIRPSWNGTGPVRRPDDAGSSEEWTVDEDSELKEVLESARTIAVVGIKSEESADAHRIPKYMQSVGARIVPVNPKLDSVLGEEAIPSLDAISVPVDLINLFRAPEHIPNHVSEILSMPTKPRAVWMQLGIHHGSAAAELRAAGITVIQDRCIMVEHRRLSDADTDGPGRG
jgi:predicted CoA-binding protein